MGVDTMRQIKKMLALLLVAALLGGTALAAGFSNDAAAMNLAAQSVLKLEAYRNDTLFATGSGFIAFSGEWLVTNYHVIDGADRIIAYTDSGDPYTIDYLLAADKDVDMAILSINSAITPLPLATSEPERGGRCIAIGSPQGYKNSFSDGMISGTLDEDGVRYVQFTAPISSGSSGGALFNDNGEVIGITTQTQVGRGGNVTQNLNFAVDIRQVTNMFYANQGKQLVSLSDSRKAADSSYRNDYVPGDVITISNMGIRVPADMMAESTSSEILLSVGDATVSVIALDVSELGGLGEAATDLLSLFWSMNDLALKSFTLLEYGEAFDMKTFEHPNIPCGLECAMTPGRYMEVDGMNKNVAMAFVNRDDCYLRLSATSPSGTVTDIQQVLQSALGCVVAP